MATVEEAIATSLEYFKGDQLAANVFVTKYAMTDPSGDVLEMTPDDMHRRLAKEFARIESKYPNPMEEDEIFGLLKGFSKVVPQGSPMAGIGNPFQIQSISNCFVIPSPVDSYGGILLSDQQLIQIMKRRGGVGFDISEIRPRGLPTSNAARTTDGIGIFMERFSNSCREVAQGGRRGALLMSVAVEHPDIETFIDIKRDRSKVTGANISIRLSDSFMEAVESDGDFDLKWPVNSDNPVIRRSVKARTIWEKIIDSAWSSAEPGVFFWDTVKKNTPSDLYEEFGFGSVSSNPCGEIVLAPYAACRLLVVNLLGFVKDGFLPTASFDWVDFSTTVQKSQRLMDDIVDLELEKIDGILKKIDDDPESEFVKQVERDLWINIRRVAEQERRTGLGITALGDTLAHLNVSYASDEGISLVELIYRELALNAYRSSVTLAEERGKFSVCDPVRESSHLFLRKIMELDPVLKKNWMKHGRRNIALTTTAPAGSVSVLTQTTSGIEPVFKLWYTRRKKINPQDVDQVPDFVDQSGDKWKEFDIFHHGFKKWMDVTGKTKEDVKESPYFGATANEIDWNSGVKIQGVAQSWLCHSISRTSNLPEDVSKDVVKNIYVSAWKAGCKGFTVYREGSRSGVLIEKKEKVAVITDPRLSGEFVTHSAPKRPESLPCDIHRVTVKGEAWTVLVGLLDGKPYEIMGGSSQVVEIPRRYKTGQLIKRGGSKAKVSVYDLVSGEGDDELRIRDVVAAFDNPNYAAFTRLLSLSLRHGASVQYIVEQLSKGDRDADLFSFAKVISRVLKTFIPDGVKPGGATDCHECGAVDSIRYQEGCTGCVNCGYSKC